MTRVSVLQFVGTRSLGKHDNRKFLKGFGHFLEENRVPYVYTEFGEGVTVQLNKMLNT
jgi:hypothetical protein